MLKEKVAKKDLDYVIGKLDKSNVNIKISVNTENRKYFMEKILRKYQQSMSVAWFRKWQAPLELVRQSINFWELISYMLEDMIEKVIKKASAEWYRFIGQIYNVDYENTIKTIVETESDGSGFEISFDIDLYPEIELKNDNYKTIKPKKIEVVLSEDEVQESLNAILNNYAEYKSVDILDQNLEYLWHINVDYNSQKDVVLKNKKIMFSKKDFDEKKLSDIKNLKKWESLVLVYDESIPKKLEEKELDWVENLKLTLIERKQLTPPEFTNEFVLKISNKEKKTTKEFLEDLKKIMLDQKLINKKNEEMDNFYQEISQSLFLQIPKTFINQELKHRIEQMKNTYKWFDYTKHLSSMKENEREIFEESMRQQAEKDIHKFFLMDYFATNNWYEKLINKNWYLDIIELYDIMTADIN